MGRIWTEFRERGKPTIHACLLCAGNCCEPFTDMISFNARGDSQHRYHCPYLSDNSTRELKKHAQGVE